jgi:hypothetical protein
MEALTSSPQRQSLRRARLTRALWIVACLLWVITIVGWPLMAFAQLTLTPDANGSAIEAPPTLFDVGFLVFIISVPAAVGITGFALISGNTATLASGWSALRAAGLASLVALLSFIAFMGAQFAAFFFLSSYITELFGLR